MNSSADRAASTRAAFPHSEILGSRLVCSSPRLIAADHVLRRLSAPRHPSRTLRSLTTENLGQTSSNESCPSASRPEGPFVRGARRPLARGRVRTGAIPLVSDSVAALSSGAVRCNRTVICRLKPLLQCQRSSRRDPRRRETRPRSGPSGGRRETVPVVRGATVRRKAVPRRPKTT